jgi:hypothetical protein
LSIALLPTAVCSGYKAADRAVCSVHRWQLVSKQQTAVQVGGGAAALASSYRMGDVRISLKTSAPLSLKTFQMNILSARSISLDSTFDKLKPGKICIKLFQIFKYAIINILIFIGSH